MIYFAQLPTGSIKIGYTGNLDQRMDALEGHYRAEPAVLHTMPGDRETEQELHRRFAHLRLGRTEQFRPGPDLLAFIGKPLLVGINPEAVESVARAGIAVRLELRQEDFDRLEKQARKLGLTKASYARMAVMERLAADEEKD